jgi:CYTH domain-containing protein
VEIERKWILDKLPIGCTSRNVTEIRQYYLSMSPEVRIRSSISCSGTVKTCTMTIKSSNKSLSRREVEFVISESKVKKLLHNHPNLPCVFKKSYDIGIRGLVISEVTYPKKFIYAEIEYESEDEAKSSTPPKTINDLIIAEVTNNPKWYMANVSKSRSSS